MSQNQPINLAEKFPRMRRVDSPPALTTLNGFGFSVYGKRDYDHETNTYVKTYCFCAIFIPLIACGAYRVADAERGWYFIGKEPLSKFARTWNWLVAWMAVFMTCGIMWTAHTSSPEYRARQELNQGAAFAKAQEPMKAAAIFRNHVSNPKFSAEAQSGLKTSLEAAFNSPKTVDGAFRIIAGLPLNLQRTTPLIPDAFNRGLQLVRSASAKDPEAALDLLRTVATLEPTNSVIEPLRIDLLKQTIATGPDRTNRVVELALIYERREQVDEAIQVLTPYRTKLGATEGARILGHHLLQQSAYEDAYGLLYPYVQTRLTKLHGVERLYTNAIARASDAALDTLRKGHAGQSFYDNYKAASKAQQGAMVDEFINQQIRNDPNCKRALAELRTANEIVTVALDLGIVQLNRAQSLSDATARKIELQAAEKTFLAINSFAGETDEYRLFLGQVYYWLGRSREGAELFDKLLVSKKRAPAWLLSLSRTLREVGDNAQARALSEEAYRTGKTDNDRFAAATTRAYLQTDSNDRISWLQKSDPNDVRTQIELSSALGSKALEQGDKESGAQYLRKAISGYQSLPKESPVLNNWGLAYLHLYEATGAIEDYDRGLALLEEAVTTAPGNSLLMINTARTFVERALMDMLGNSIRLAATRERANFQMLTHLYANERERETVYQRLRDNQHFKKALVHLDKALLLAPKNIGLYREQLHLLSMLRDAAGLQKLQQRFKIAEIDLSEDQKELQAELKGDKDHEHLQQVQTSIQTHEAMLRDPAVNGHPLTAEYVRGALIGLKESAADYGAKVDSRQLVQDAGELHEKHRCSATHSILAQAYAFRAQEELTEQSPDFARFARETRRTLSREQLFALLLQRDDALAKLITANPNVQKMIELEKEEALLFPNFRGPHDWALLHTTAPEEAARISEFIRQDPVVGVHDALQYELFATAPSVVLQRHWFFKSTGDEKSAGEVLRVAAAKGVPLPQF